MAFDYHGFVAELGLLAAAEAEQAGRSVSPTTWADPVPDARRCGRVVDVRARAPRQGDSDDGRALVLGPHRDQQVGEPAGARRGGVRRTGLVARYVAGRGQRLVASMAGTSRRRAVRPGAPATSPTPA